MHALAVSKEYRKVFGIYTVVMECKVALFRSNHTLHTYGKHDAHLFPDQCTLRAFYAYATMRAKT